MEQPMNGDRTRMVTPDPSIVHQLKNRLTVVKGVAQLLDRQVRRDDWQREKIVERVERLQDEIAQLEELIAGYTSDDEALLDERTDDGVY